jgi:hypothetical protein
MASEHLVGGLPENGNFPSDFPTDSNFPSDFPTDPGAGSPSAAQVETAPATMPRPAIDWRVRFADLESPEHHVAALGARPAFVDEHRRYDRVARAIDTYRERFAVSGADPLGPRPFETFPRLAYDEVAAQIRDYEKVRWRELRRLSPGIGGRDIEVPEISGIDAGLEL